MDMAGTLSGEATRLSRCDVRAGGSALSVTGALTGLGDRPAVDARVVAREVALRDVAAVLGWFGPLLPSGLGSAGEVSVDARVRGPLDDPSRLSIEGRASLDGVEYRDPSLKAPITGIGGAVALGGGRAAITGFTASLGASRVEGACALSRFERPVLDVRLSSPNLDVDELLSLVAAAPAGAAVVPASGARERGVVRARRPAAPEPVPSSLLRDVTVRGELAVKQAKVINLRLADARAQLALEAGVARLRDVEVRLYGGRLTGEVSAAPAEAGPPFDLSARVEGVDFNALASDLSPDLRGLVHGTLQARLDVRGRGLGTPELRRALAGTAAIALADGKVTSFGLLKTLAKALEKAGGRGIGKEETPFRSLTGTFEIAKGRARTEDLELDSDDLDVKGKGALALDLGLDLDLGARIAAPVAADMVAATPSLRHLQDDKGRLALDFTLGGTLLEPSVGIAPEMLRRAARSAAKEKLKEKKKDVLEKLLGKGE
jgi:AsmA protein